MMGQEADWSPDLRMLLSVQHLLLQEALSCLQAAVPLQSLCNDTHGKKKNKKLSSGRPLTLKRGIAK